MLGILNFREPTDPKSRSLIYQYAVYTPQEEMKQILALPPDLRLQILRRAFGVDEYKLAMENAKELLKKIHEKKVQFEAASRDVPALTREMTDLKGKASRGEEELKKLEQFEQDEEKSLRRLEEEKDELHEVETQLASARSDQTHLQHEIEDGKEEVEGIATEIRELERKAGQLSARARQASEAVPSERSAEELKAAIVAARDAIDERKASDAEIRLKIGQYESVAEKGRCPVCDRDASPEEFAQKVGRLSNERKASSVHLEHLGRELRELEEALERRRKHDAQVEKAKDDLARAREYEEDSEKKRKRQASAREGIADGEKKLSELESRIRVLEGEARGLEPLRQKIEASKRALEATRESVASLRVEVRNWRDAAQRNAELIVRKERSASRARELGEREIWLEEYFIPTVETIERHVMTSINREFGHNFQRWFSILVEDGEKEARVDEDFAPLVDQGGYEQDIEFLSGGERTSVALAYRLALSQMVQKFAEVGPSALILDEPTDGFSKEQLGNMREILDEMANPQVVIVSHERELESMADQIYRVTKVEGESKISR
jgi:exonuclease SbcC